MAELIRSGDIYSSGDHFILPVTDAPQGQELLASVYLRFKQEGVLPIFFHEGVPDLCTFLSLMLKPKSLTMACFSRSPHKDAVVGIGHVVAPVDIGNGYNKSEVSMAFFKEYQRPRITVSCAHLMLQYVFERCAEIEALFGCTPEPNRAAVRFIGAVGFKRSVEAVEAYSTYNGQLCGCYISWMTKTRWQEISPFEWV